MIVEGMVEYVLGRIRPQIQADGGDVEVTRIDQETGTVFVALKGACVDCPLSAITLSQGIERVLVEHVEGVKHVLPDPEKTEVLRRELENMDIPGLERDDEDEDEDDEYEDYVRYRKEAARQGTGSSLTGSTGMGLSSGTRVTKVDEDGNITEETVE